MKKLKERKAIHVCKKKDPNKIKLDKHIGIKLRNKRVERKLNQTKKVANVLMVTFQQIQKFEKGSNGLSAFYLGKLAKFFKVPVSYISLMDLVKQENI